MRIVTIELLRADRRTAGSTLHGPNGARLRAIGTTQVSDMSLVPFPIREGGYQNGDNARCRGRVPRRESL